MTNDRNYFLIEQLLQKEVFYSNNGSEFTDFIYRFHYQIVETKNETIIEIMDEDMARLLCQNFASFNHSNSIYSQRKERNSSRKK